MGADQLIDDFNLAPAEVVYAGAPVVAEQPTSKRTKKSSSSDCLPCCYFSCGWMYLVLCALALVGLTGSLWFFAVPPNWGLTFEVVPLEFDEPITVAGIVPGQYYSLLQVDLANVEEESATTMSSMKLCIRTFGNGNVKASADLGFVPNILFDTYANQSFEESFESESGMLADYQFWEGRTVPTCASGSTLELTVCNKNQKVWVVVENEGPENIPAPFEVKFHYGEYEGDALCYDELAYDTFLVLFIVLFSLLFCTSAICGSLCCSWFCLSGPQQTEEEEEDFIPLVGPMV